MGLGIALFALYPLDLRLSWSELSAKLAAGHVAWLVARGDGTAPVRLALKYVAVVMMFLPIGWFTARRGARDGRGLMANPVLFAVAFSSVLELIQLFLGSARTEGMAVISAAAGARLGTRAEGFVRELPAKASTRRGGLLIVLLGICYLMLLMYIRELLPFGDDDHRQPHTVSSWKELLPFYQYHFYIHSGASMLLSVLGQMLLGSGAGFLAYPLVHRLHADRFGSMRIAGQMVAGLFLAIEIARVCVGRQVDSVDWLLCSLGGVLGYCVVYAAMRAFIGRAR